MSHSTLTLEGKEKLTGAPPQVATDAPATIERSVCVNGVDVLDAPPLGGKGFGKTAGMSGALDRLEGVRPLGNAGPSTA